MSYEVIDEITWTCLSDKTLCGLQVFDSCFFEDFVDEQRLGFVISDWLGKRYKYYELLDISQEDLAQKERFLADYHVLRYLEKEACTDRVIIGRLAVALSNLLRFCSGYNIDELHYMSIRIIRKFSEILQKDIFVITEY